MATAPSLRTAIHARIRRHRRGLAAAASAAIAAAVFIVGAIPLSQMSPGFPGELAPAASSDPVEISPDLAEAFAGESGATEMTDSDDAAPPSEGADEDGERTEEAVRMDDDLSQEPWFDSDTGEAQIMVMFNDEGVAPEAQGDPELAAASLRAGAGSALRSARPALQQLEDDGVVEVVNEFWLMAGVLVTGEPTEETLTALSRLPGAKSVEPNYEVEPLADKEGPVEPVTPRADHSHVDADGNPVTYGLDQINAPEAWDEYGALGQGVRVAVLDTGVDPNHPDIAANLVTEDPEDPLYPGGWMFFDYQGNTQAKRPSDPGTHGTHVAGTVLGGDASGTKIGVAPEAELMAVNALSNGSSNAKILKAFEWVMAPYDIDGNPAGRAADVVNMSFGTDEDDTTLFGALQRLRSAGIFPAAATGNDMDTRPGCISNPSSSADAFGVGMTDENDDVSPASCGGTTAWPQDVVERFGWETGRFTKPDASAPGTRVISSVPGGGWGASSGTSMATPHVAGAVASLRSAQAGLSVDDIEHALEQTAWHPGKEQAGDGFVPDDRYGNGRIDLAAAIAQVRGEAGVDVTITDAETRQALPGVTVSYDADHGETWSSDEDGKVRSFLAPADYTLAFERFGYEQTTQAVTVPQTGFAEMQIAMTPLSTGTVTGTVTDADTKQPVAGATVSLVGADLSTRTAEDGTYTLANVPRGTHEFRASADGKHTAASKPANVFGDVTTTVDFTMSDLPKALVLGEATGRSTELLNGEDIVATASDALPENLEDLAAYDVVVWDDPGAVSAETLKRVVEITDRAGTGVVWLDLGTSDTSGIAQLNSLLGDPAERTGTTEPSDSDVTAVGYRISVSEHPLLAAGDLHPADLFTGSFAMQDTQPGVRKSHASFAGLQSTTARGIANTVVQHTDDNGVVTTEVEGPGIAVDERGGNRHVYLALHGTTNSVDARSWSPGGQQLFANSANWAAQSEKPSEPEQPDPETPVPPVPPPGDGGNAGNGGGAQRSGDNGGVASPSGGTPSTARNGAAEKTSKAPSAQKTPKPELTPEAPVAGENQLTKKNSGGVTVRVKDDIAYVKIPDSEPGDWFFLHVYPSKTAVDWIRVNDSGELRIDISTLQDGEYKFAFTDKDEKFVGWVAVTIGEVTTTQSVTDPATALPNVAAPGGFQLSTGELLMLLGAALLLLTAAGVVLLGLRTPPRTVGAIT